MWDHMFCRTFFLRLRQVFGSIVFGSIRMLRNVTQTIYTSRWSSRWWLGKWNCDLFSSNWYQIWPIWSNCLDFTIESLFATQKCKFRNRGLDHAKDYLVKRSVFWIRDIVNVHVFISYEIQQCLHMLRKCWFVTPKYTQISENFGSLIYTVQ